MSDPKRKVAVIFGTRPEAIKLAPVILALRAEESLETIVIASGQHRELVAPVTELFRIRVDHDLNVMAENQALGKLSARLMERLDGLLGETRPDFALVQGDTTTVLCAGLCCFYRGIPIGHIEAGLRTRDLHEPFPEEMNRRAASLLASLHFAPTAAARQNLLAEGVNPERVHVTGNTVIDALQMELAAQRDPAVWSAVEAELAGPLGAGWPERPFVLVTNHRRENFGAPLEQCCAAIRELAGRLPEVRFVCPVHPNPNVREPVHARLGGVPNVHLLAPQPYRALVALLSRCRLVLTDSGGMQEEAPGVGKPVLVMRDVTERPEGPEWGVALLVGTRAETIVAETLRLLTDDAAYENMVSRQNPYGDGRAAGRIVALVREYLA